MNIVPIWKAPVYNSPYMNWKRGMWAMSAATFTVTPFLHVQHAAQTLNQFYEWPKTRQEYNIFAKETFRVPNFWKDLGKKLTWGLVMAGGDTAIKLSFW